MEKFYERFREAARKEGKMKKIEFRNEEMFRLFFGLCLMFGALMLASYLQKEKYLEENRRYIECIDRGGLENVCSFEVAFGPRNK